MLLSFVFLFFQHHHLAYLVLPYLQYKLYMYLNRNCQHFISFLTYYCCYYVLKTFHCILNFPYWSDTFYLIWIIVPCYLYFIPLLDCIKLYYSLFLFLFVTQHSLVRIIYYSIFVCSLILEDMISDNFV